MSSAKSDRPTAPSSSIGAVVVTYNRLLLLQECITAIRSQTRPADEIIVVNNGSTDGTAEWLATQPDLTVITQPNSGSSGGQYTGIRTAYYKGHDWFWCMDDDTIPEPDALAALTRAPYINDSKTGFLASVVLWTDGLPWGDSHNRASHPSDWFLTVLQDRCVRAAEATFVSILIHRTAVTEVGLPFRDFFLLVDDTEYTTRITEKFRGYYVLDSRVVHKTTECSRLGNTNLNPRSIKYGYWIRNGVILTRMRIKGITGRWSLLLLQFLKLFRSVLTRQQPAGVLRWFWRGLIHPIRIDRV